MTADHDELRKAIKHVRRQLLVLTSGPEHCMIRDVCDAAESTLPRTKMVEVWCVHYAYRYENGEWTPRVIDGSREYVESFRACRLESDQYAYWRITGPHTQEVPV